MSQAFSRIKKKTQEEEIPKSTSTYPEAKTQEPRRGGAIFKKYCELKMFLEEGSQRLITKGRKIEYS